MDIWGDTPFSDKPHIWSYMIQIVGNLALFEIYYDIPIIWVLDNDMFNITSPLYLH